MRFAALIITVNRQRRFIYVTLLLLTLIFLPFLLFSALFLVLTYKQRKVCKVADYASYSIFRGVKEATVFY